MYARATLTKGAFASKIFHTFRVQAPYKNACDDVLQSIQKTLDTLVFGGFAKVTYATAQQPTYDGGFGHLNVARRMRAEWAHFACQLGDCEPAVWKNIWWYRLRQVYGPLCDRDFVFSTCAFKSLTVKYEPSQVATDGDGMLG